MPERNGYTRKQMAYTVAQAHLDGLLVKVTCQHCRITRLYLPKDLLTLCGPIGIHEIAQWFRCEKCDQKHNMVADWMAVYGPDVRMLRVRRLVRVKYKRVPVWKDGPL